ncbi:uncharacterized protein LOC117643086 [Thrips palmi]|uniref:Uncharacterized protein LOC117643086 n=1 Tax=Thrips palmi TaxID=161013 RepID=A0A6P8YKS3_THRPL|nr:uncharacterized protein LOC117643086 [Thrips palmi]
MKEHRVRTLRVTTPSNIASRERGDAGQADDSLWGVQVLQLQLGPACRACPEACPEACPDFGHVLGLADGKGGPRGAAPSLCTPGPASEGALHAPTFGAVPNGACPDRRRPVCSICGPNVGAQPKRRSVVIQQRRPAGDFDPESSSDSSSSLDRLEAIPGAGASSCTCAGPCVQPLLHLLSGDLDRCFDDVLLALRLLVQPGDAPRLVDGVTVNGVTVRPCAERGVRVCACGREAVLAVPPGRGPRGAGPPDCWLAGRDAGGHTPLLLAGRRLLTAGRWADAARVAALLLAAGCDANAVNREGRSLLSYAVAALDDALDTTRLLLNHGATVWGHEVEGHSLRMPPAASQPDPPAVFAWFLRAVIRRRRLDEGCLRTLALVSHAMADRPRHMHGLVLRTMFRHSRCYRVLGPVFLQIKTAMARHWSRPQDLRVLCRRAVRRALGPAKLHAGVASLGLPGPLQDYLLLHS